MRIFSKFFIRNLSLSPAPISPPSLHHAYIKPTNTPVLTMRLHELRLLIMECSHNTIREQVRSSIFSHKFCRRVIDGAYVSGADVSHSMLAHDSASSAETKTKTTVRSNPNSQRARFVAHENLNFSSPLPRASCRKSQGFISKHANVVEDKVVDGANSIGPQLLSSHRVQTRFLPSSPVNSKKLRVIATLEAILAVLFFEIRVLLDLFPTSSFFVKQKIDTTPEFIEVGNL